MTESTATLIADLPGSPRKSSGPSANGGAILAGGEADRADAIVSGIMANGGDPSSPQEVDFRAIVPWLRSNERATHLLHSYPARTIRQIPYLFSQAGCLSHPGDVVLDPFCGSGTTLLEASLASRNGVGLDANPLAVLIASVKINPPPRLCLSRACDELESALAAPRRRPHRPTPAVVNLSYLVFEERDSSADRDRRRNR